MRISQDRRRTSSTYAQPFDERLGPPRRRVMPTACGRGTQKASAQRQPLTSRALPLETSCAGTIYRHFRNETGKYGTTPCRTIYLGAMRVLAQKVQILCMR